MHHSQTQPVMIGWKSNIISQSVLILGSARMATSSQIRCEMIYSVLFQLQTLFCDLHLVSTQYLNCKTLHGGDVFAALTKRSWNAKVL